MEKLDRDAPAAMERQRPEQPEEREEPSHGEWAAAAANVGGGPDSARLNEALIAIRRILRATDIHAKRLGRETNLTTSQLLVLQTMAEEGEMTVGEIAAKVSLAQASVTSIIDRLQGMSLVYRERGSTDKRKVFVKLTEAGSTLLDKAPTALHDRFSDAFRELEPWEQSMIVAVLGRVASMMDADRIQVAPVLDMEQIGHR